MFISAHVSTFFWGGMCCWDSQFAPCVVLLSKVSRNISGIGLNNQNSVCQKLYLIMNLKCMLCKRTLNLGSLGVKALVQHTKLEKHQLASNSLQRSHAITHFCTPSSRPSCPVLIGPNSNQFGIWARKKLIINNDIKNAFLYHSRHNESSFWGHSDGNPDKSPCNPSSAW